MASMEREDSASSMEVISADCEAIYSGVIDLFVVGV